MHVNRKGNCVLRKLSFLPLLRKLDTCLEVKGKTRRAALPRETCPCNPANRGVRTPSGVRVTDIFCVAVRVVPLRVVGTEEAPEAAFPWSSCRWRCSRGSLHLRPRPPPPSAREDSLAEEVFGFPVDVDGAQALQRGEDVGEQRGTTVVLQPLERIDGTLELPAWKGAGSGPGHPPLGPPRSGWAPTWNPKSQSPLVSKRKPLTCDQRGTPL